jgi:ribosomal protein S27AE
MARRRKTIHCEECVEEIPFAEIEEADGRLLCGRCGSELEPQSADVFEEITGGRVRRFYSTDDDDTEDDLDEDEDKVRVDADEEAENRD